MRKYLLLFTLLLSSCAVIVEATRLDELNESHTTWKQTVEKNGANYQYSVNFSSWVGFRNTTVLLILDSQVIQREYKAWDRDGVLLEQWVEDGLDSIGNHTNGAEPKTIDELYWECNSILLTKSLAENHITFNLDDNGILKQCLYAPRNCADDCSSGVNIDELFFNL